MAQQKTGPKSKQSRTQTVPGLVDPGVKNKLQRKIKDKTAGLSLDADDFGSMLADSILKTNKKPSAQQGKPPQIKAKTEPRTRKTSAVDEEEGATGDGKLLDDLTWVYKKLGGRAKLLRLMRKDEKMRSHFLKVMLTLEVKRELEGGKGGNGKGGALGSGNGKEKRNFFMIFRGLEEEKEKKIVKGLEKGKIGINDIQNILNPMQDEYSKPTEDGPISHEHTPFVPGDGAAGEVTEEDIDREMEKLKKELADMTDELYEDAEGL